MCDPLIWEDWATKLPLILIPEAVLMLRCAAAVMRAEGQTRAKLSGRIGLQSLCTVSSSVSLLRGLLGKKLS